MDMERSISMGLSARRLRLPLVLASIFVTLVVGGLAVQRPRAKVHLPSPPPAAAAAAPASGSASPSTGTTATPEQLDVARPAAGDPLRDVDDSAGTEDRPLLHLQGPTMIVKVTVPRHRTRHR
jgi:hypothetical protein